jgi:hypothetical protein
MRATLRATLPAVCIATLRTAVLLLIATTSLGQTPAPAAAPAKPDDTPSYKIGAVIFGDFTYQASPNTKDVDGNSIHASSFNITRAYINVTGQLNHRISFRITPDVARESGSGSSLGGSQNFRLKYAFGQLNLEDWVSKGAWIRLGVQQTPLIDYSEGIYRYRFQGTMFAEREGFLTSSDAGLTGHYDLKGGYGELHGGYYNGEGYSRSETNNEKALQLRATVRPLPKDAFWKGLRVTAFYDGDHFVQDGKRQRLIEQVTFESARLNAGFEHLNAKDRPSVATREISSDGWSVWAVVRAKNGFELLLRHDTLEPDDETNLDRARNIAGVAYWVPNLQKVSAALMVDYDSLQQSNYVPARPRDTRYGLKMYIQF